MLKAGVKEARAVQKLNAQDTWAARNPQVNAADSLNASNRIWKGMLEIGIRPKFAIAPSESVFAMGSCFAREIEEALVASGFDVPTCCDPLFAHPLLRAADQDQADAARLRPRSYLNRYNSMSLYEELRHLLGLAPDLEQGGLIYPLDNRAAADLHYSQALPQRSVAEQLQRRSLVRDFLGQSIRRCSVFVFTLGLAEAWYDVRADRYLNNTPGPRVMEAYADQLEVHLTTFGQHRTALDAVHRLLSEELGRPFKIVITVSPVPMEKTFFNQDVITTNSYSKSMLRAVAQEFADGHANVDYFPSYEVVNYSRQDAAWVWDYRHVRPALVRHITDGFRRHYVVGEAIS